MTPSYLGIGGSRDRISSPAFLRNSTPRGCLCDSPPPRRSSPNPIALQTVQPQPSSWGYGGYSEFWINETNDWVYPLLVKACDRLTQAIQDHPRAGESQKRAFNQALRELLLAQASDWAFMMKTGHHREYARSRVLSHLERMNLILDTLDKGCP